MNPLQYWTVDGFEISSYKFQLSTKLSKKFMASGSDNTGKCMYTYNSLGFRGDEPTKEGFKIMSIGDSNTEGVGVNDHETWPAQFTKLIPNGVNHNFGMGGRSNDYICRCLLSYYDFIKPDLVLIMYTSPFRREIYTQENGIEPFMVTGSWGYLSETKEGKRIQELKTELQNENEDYINWYKNHLLIKYFLESKNCNWLWNGWMEIDKNYEEFNRFDGKYGGHFIDFGADGVHPGPKHNLTYVNRLYEYICKNFRNYLPDDLTINRNLI
jgi:lysophospholipase L1-like esterase